MQERKKRHNKSHLPCKIIENLPSVLIGLKTGSKTKPLNHTS